MGVDRLSIGRQQQFCAAGRVEEESGLLGVSRTHKWVAARGHLTGGRRRACVQAQRSAV